MKSNDRLGGNTGPRAFAERAEAPLDVGTLKAFMLYPNVSDIDSGFKLVAREISEMFRAGDHLASLTFEFHELPDCLAFSDYEENRHTIYIDIGLYKRLQAIFRQLSLTNAFGKYAQTTRFDRDALANLLTNPEIAGLRIQEDAVSIDSLLNVPGASEPDPKQLEAYLSRPPKDTKHKFDIQSLMVPAVTFAFWHELGHVLMGHTRWQPETDEYEKHALGLEYIADDYAAKRIAHDILQSALREEGCYVIGPFWINRSGFEAVGKLDGIPGENIEFNLEGFMYRIAFALQVLVYHFRGFFLEPVAHIKKSHPHPEVRLARIVEAIKLHMLTAKFESPDQEYLAEMWEAMFAYAMFTARLALQSCHATQLPGTGEGGMFGDMFHVHEIQARVKASSRRVENAIQATAGFGYEDVLAGVGPLRGFLTFPKDKAAMIEIVDDFPRIFERKINMSTGMETLTIDELVDVLVYGTIAPDKDDKEWKQVSGVCRDKRRFYFERDALRATAIVLSLAAATSIESILKVENSFWNKLEKVNSEIKGASQKYAKTFMTTYSMDHGASLYARFSRQCAGGAEVPELMHFARKEFVVTLTVYRELLKRHELATE